MFSFCSIHKENHLDFSSTIEDDRKTLGRIIAGLFALSGLTAGQFKSIAPPRIARAVHRAVACVLRPAESSVRRLIVLVSMTVKTNATTKRPMPSGIIRKGEANTRICFRLFDPRVRLADRSRKSRATPRISFFGDGEVRTVDLGRKLQGPLRPGYPPGHRIRPLHEIDEVLRCCDWRARQALPQDTS
jgi:hypothetical protein